MRGVVALAILTAGFLVTGCARPRAPVWDPVSADDHNDLGVAYHTRGEFELAARQFRRALALRPGWARAFVNLGDAQLALGLVDEAISAYERAHVVGPANPATANNLAWALLQHEGRWPEAEPLIRGALARDPQPRGYYLDTLGLLFLKKGEPRAALEALRAALADPQIRERRVRALVLRRTGEALSRLGDIEGADRCDRVARDLLASEEASPENVGPGETVC
ncbi:MAG: tetratricopeptide repeat protein [Candidatus Rokuibacteriota bacterium]